ncbi:MAG: histidine kinase N-terminal 7TM domain-containing protein [Chloroflexota bacterium]
MTFLEESPNAFGPVSLALFVVAIVYASLGMYVLAQGGRSATARYLGGMMFAMAWWSFGYAVEIHASELNDKLFWVKVEYFGVVVIPFLWLCFVLEHAGRSALLTRRNKWLAMAIPTFTLLAVWTNEIHHWVYVESHTQTVNDLVLLETTRGWLFWLFSAYSYLFIAGGAVVLLLYSFHTSSLFRAQAYLILAGTLLTWIGNAVYLAGLSPVPGLDLTPFAFIPTGFVTTWAIARYRLLDIIPPAQAAILQNLRDGVTLVDREGRVAYLNRAAEEILGVTSERALGQPAGTVCRACAPFILPLMGEAEQRVELALDVNGETRDFEATVSPGYFTEKERQQKRPLHTVVFHDITQRNRARAALKSREAILHAVSLASELFLKSSSWDRNVEKVLARLGEAAEVSRVYIFERHLAETGVPVVSQRYEWAREGVVPQIDNPDLQNLEWEAAGFARWEETFQKRGAVHGPVREFPESERAILAAQDILSLVVMPVFVEENLWGFVGFDECAREREWSEPELEALRAAADIFGAALTRGNVETRLLKRQRVLDLLQNIIRVSLEKSDLKEMGRFLVDHLGILIGADNCFINLWDERQNKTIPLAAYGAYRDTYADLTIIPGEKTFTSSALEAGHTLAEEDAKNSPYCSPRIAAQFSTVSMLALPMVSGEKKLGAILLGFSQPHRFTREEIEISEQAAHLISLALDKFRAAQEAHRRAEESDTLRRAWVAISETLNLQDTITRLLEQLAYVLPHDSASVQLLRDGELEIVGGEGWRDVRTVIGLRFPIPADNPNTVVIQTGKPYLVDDTYESFPIFRELDHASHIRSWLGVPLIVRNKIVGLLAIDSRQTFHFTPDDADLASAFASQVAVAIENARLFDEVQRLAITDGLTGLANRRRFLEMAEIEFQRALRYKRNLSAMIFDIDHFKEVNDTYGHPIGDRVLQAIAALCHEKLREADPIGRYGGEEFAALVVETSPENALRAGERLRQAVEDMVVPTEKGEIKVTISVGVAGMNETTPNLETLINRADQAMYVAKHKGRNRVVVGR